MRLANALIGSLVVVTLAGCSTSSPVTSKTVSTTTIGDVGTDASATTVGGTTDGTAVTDETTPATATTKTTSTTIARTTGATSAVAFTIPEAPTTVPATIPATDAGSGAPASGTVFTSDAGKFSAAFDATPNETVNPASATSAEAHVFQAVVTNAVEVVSYAVRNNAGADRDNVLKVTVDAIMSTSGFLEVSRASTTYQNFPAVEFEAKGTDGGNAVRVFGRVVLGDTVLYGALYEFKTGLAGGVDAAHQFIDSFKVLGN